MIKTLNGQQVLTISELVDNFNLAQGNMKGSNFLQTLSHAKWAWKDVFRGTLWDVKTVVIKVSEQRTITIPNDCERQLLISVVDKYGKTQPLGYNPSYNTAKITCPEGNCSCKNCEGQDTLCAAIDNITATEETVMIQGMPYILTTYTRILSNGDIQTDQRIPTFDEGTNTVITQQIVKVINTLQVTSTGCIMATQPNVQMLIDYCGLGFYFNRDGFRNGINQPQFRELIPTTYNFYGEWNYDAKNKCIIHIFRRDHHIDGGIDNVIFTYQTNGEEADTEILIPEYAKDAVDTGILYRQRLFNPRDRDTNREGLYAFRRSKKEITKYLNPVQMQDLIKLQAQIPKW